MFAVLDANPPGWGTSLLPTGLYRFRRGAHKAGQPTAQPGVLINDEPNYVVLRTTRALCYDVYNVDNVWTPGQRHNIHAAFSSGSWSILRYSGDRARSSACGPDSTTLPSSSSTIRATSAVGGVQ